MNFPVAVMSIWKGRRKNNPGTVYLLIVGKEPGEEHQKGYSSLKEGELIPNQTIL